MKKLQLKALELKAFEILTREELKNQIGSGSSSMSFSVSSGVGGGHKGCGHNISCGGGVIGDICGSYQECLCQSVAGSLYCRRN